MNYKLFVAGPVSKTDNLKKIIQFPDIVHREREFEELYKDMKDKLFKVFNSNKKSFDIAIISGSGTSALETMFSSVVNKKILVISNGAFGERAYEICRIYRLPRIYLRYEWGEYPKITEIEKILIENPDIEFVSMVYMETSTGMLNPIKEVGELCKKYNKTYLIDAVCAIGCEKLDMEEFNIDFCAVSSNKGIGGPPVIGIICCRKNKLIKLQRRNMYLDLDSYLKYGKFNQTPFTPSIPLFYILNENLTELLKEGLENRLNRFKSNCDLLKSELTKLGFELYLKDNMSNIMVNVLIPAGLNYNSIHDGLKNKGFIIYAGKSELKDKVMHIATIGTITESDVKEFIINLKEIIK